MDRVILGFDSDAAGHKATLAAGRKLAARVVSAFDVEVFTAPAGSDPAGILAASGPESLAAALTDSEQRGTLLDLLVEDRLNRYDWTSVTASLRDLPIGAHAAYESRDL